MARSIAMPRLTCSGRTIAGLPSTSAKELFISGCSTSARTSAYPIRWVKLTLPPRPRARWLLITMRLSTSSLAGTARTLVAVGTASEASMFCDDLGGDPAQRRGAARRRPVGALAAGLAAAALRSRGLAAGLAAGFGAVAGCAAAAAWRRPPGPSRAVGASRPARPSRRRPAPAGAAGSGGGGLPSAVRRAAARRRRAGSRRRSRARPSRRWLGRRGSAGTSPRRSTRSGRNPPVGSPAKSAGSTRPVIASFTRVCVSRGAPVHVGRRRRLPGYAAKYDRHFRLGRVACFTEDAVVISLVS